MQQGRTGNALSTQASPEAVHLASHLKTIEGGVHNEGRHIVPAHLSCRSSAPGGLGQATGVPRLRFVYRDSVHAEDCKTCGAVRSGTADTPLLDTVRCGCCKAWNHLRCSSCTKAVWPPAAARTGSGMTLTVRLAIHTSRLLPSTPSVTRPAPSCSSATTVQPSWLVGQGHRPAARACHGVLCGPCQGGAA